MQLFHNNGDGTFSEVTHKEGLPDLLGKGMGIAMTNILRRPGTRALCRQ